MGNKIGIIYFSGTGNTKFVAQNIAKKLQRKKKSNILRN